MRDNQNSSPGDENGGVLRGGEEGGEIKGEEAVAEKEGADGPGTQKGGEREAVFGGFAVKEKENTTYHAAAHEGKEGGKKGQFPPQKKPDSSGELHVSKAHAPGEKGVQEEKEAKKNQSPQKMGNFLLGGDKAENPQKKHCSHGPIGDAKGPKVKEGDENEEGSKKKGKNHSQSSPGGQGPREGDLDSQLQESAAVMLMMQESESPSS